jgi:hypothetical protein
MRDPKRIDKILARVREVWKTYPDLRLLQLLLNTLPKDSMAYYIEDDELMKRIEAQYYDNEQLYNGGKIEHNKPKSKSHK